MNIKVSYPYGAKADVDVYATLAEAIDIVKAMLEIDADMMQAFVKEPLIMQIEVTREAVTDKVIPDGTKYTLGPNQPEPRKPLKSV